MLTAHKLRRLCRFYWLQRVQNVYRSGHVVLNHTQRFGSVVTFNSNVAGRDRYIRSVLHNGSGSQMVKCFHLATKRLCTHSANRRCWSCGSSAPSFFCPSCKLVQPPAERTSYFDILDCEHTFALDTQGLQRTYLQLQRSLHPDNFSQKTSKEQEYSAEQSALVNRAYKTLLKPLSRGLYMLELKGMHLEEGTDMAADPQLLMEVMRINETLAETWSQHEVDAIGQSMRERLKDLTEQINTALNKGDLQSAKALLAQMKYFANIEEKVKEKLSELAECATK